MAVAMVKGILEDGRRIGFELNNASVVWGDARTIRAVMHECGMRVGDIIDFQLKDDGELDCFRVLTEKRET